MKKLFDYFDYQEYLRDYYEEKKRCNSYFSYRYLSERLGLDAGFLVKVLQGKLHVSNKSIQPIASFLKLTGRETAYFETLVRYNKAKSHSDIKLYFEKLVSLRGTRAKPLQLHQYAFYQKWYHSAIHALLSIYRFKGDFRKLASVLEPTISVKQAKDSIELMVRLGMIKKDDVGIFTPVNTFVTTGEKWQSAAVEEFQKETIKLSADALERCPKEVRDISTLTIAASEKDLPEIRERIARMRQSILTMENDNEPDRVFHINIQVIPVTRNIGGSE